MPDEVLRGQIRELTRSADDEAVAGVWTAATDARRDGARLKRLAGQGDAPLQRPGAFGVGVVEGDVLVSMAVALPALEDNGRSARPIPGLVHISSVATLPGLWGEGLGRRVMLAVLSQAKRRGYARAQLWTHASNPTSRHLYEAGGFVYSGRAMVDDGGEDIVHYISELSGDPRPPRPAARLLCLDPTGRVLLMHWRDPFDGFQVWEPPGGGIEAGETPEIAVLREWDEEIGLPAPELIGEPVLVARDLWWMGERYVGDEYFFLGRARGSDPPDVSGQTEIEQAAYVGHAWLRREDLAALDSRDQPDAAAVLRRLATDGPWAEPE